MGNDVFILTEADLRQLVALDLKSIEVVERAFVALASGKVVMPPILSMAIRDANGEVDVKTAWMSGLDSFAIKISPGFFDNPMLGLPSLNGLMVVLSAKTGVVEALLLDNGYLTGIRTAAAGAVAARHLAPSRVETAGVIGSGAQARLQLKAAHLARPFRQALVWGRDRLRAEACACDIRTALGIEARYEADPARLVSQSQLVVTTTPVNNPIVRAEWLHPGLHITAMGSDQPDKNEIEAAAIAVADIYVADRVSQCQELGELRSAIVAGLWKRGAPAELGEIIGGTKRGRIDDSQVTICDLTGTGVQDTAIATLALGVARKVGAGSVITT